MSYPEPIPDDQNILYADAISTQRRVTQWYPRVASGLGIIFTAFSVGITFFPLDYQQLQLTGYSGVFFANLFGSATIILPAPKALAVIALASELNPLLVGIVAGVGSGLGETTGYYIGYVARIYVPLQNRLYIRLDYWMARFGFLTILVFASVPNPLFDIAGLTAGVHRYPVLKFLLAATLGNILKNVAIAYLSDLII